MDSQGPRQCDVASGKGSGPGASGPKFQSQLPAVEGTDDILPALLLFATLQLLTCLTPS